MRLQRTRRQFVAGVFDRDDRPFVDQDAGEQRDRLLRAADDDDIVRVAHHAAPPREVFADRLTQDPQAGARRIAPTADARRPRQIAVARR